MAFRHGDTLDCCVLKNGSLRVIYFLEIKLDSNTPRGTYLLLKTSYFKADLGSWRVWEGGQRFPLYPCPHRHSLPPIISTPTRTGGTFVTTDELPRTRHNRPKSTVYTRVPSWCCSFCAFGQTYNGKYLLFWYHTGWFHCPKKPSVLHLFIPAPQPLETTIFLRSPQLCFFQNVASL